MSSSQDIAYLVPKPLWERLQEKLKSGETAPTPQQAGGGVVGLDGHGNVDASQLLQAMAVNMDIASNPQAPFVKYANEMLKKVMSDPNISQEDKVTYMASYVKSYNTQKHKAQTPAQTPTVSTVSKPSIPDLKQEVKQEVKQEADLITSQKMKALEDQIALDKQEVRKLTAIQRKLKLQKIQVTFKKIKKYQAPGAAVALKK